MAVDGMRNRPNVNRETNAIPENLLLEPRFDRIETGLWIFALTRFLHANRSPLRLKTLYPKRSFQAGNAPGKGRAVAAKTPRAIERATTLAASMPSSVRPTSGSTGFSPVAAANSTAPSRGAGTG